VMSDTLTYKERERNALALLGRSPHEFTKVCRIHRYYSMIVGYKVGAGVPCAAVPPKVVSSTGLETIACVSMVQPR